MPELTIKEAVAFKIWATLRDKHFSVAQQSVDTELALFKQCLDAVENKRPMQVGSLNV